MEQSSLGPQKKGLEGLGLQENGFLLWAGQSFGWNWALAGCMGVRMGSASSFSYFTTSKTEAGSCLSVPCFPSLRTLAPGVLWIVVPSPTSSLWEVPREPESSNSG